MHTVTYKVPVLERERLQREAIRLGVSVSQLIEKAVLAQKFGPELKVDSLGRLWIQR